MWPTTRGMRILKGAEARLALGAIGMMVDRLVAEARSETGTNAWGIDWFDQWEVGQRIWLLEQVTTTFLTEAALEPAAIFDATVDTIFLEVHELITLEIDEPDLIEGRSWREDLNAALSQHATRAGEDPLSRDGAAWARAAARLSDEILGVRNYQRAEAFRDQDYARTVTFLRDRGLPEDYLSRIPPLRSVEQTQLSIDRIQAYVFA